MTALHRRPSTPDSELARRLATEAGAHLLALREQNEDPDRRRTEGDRGSNEFLVAALADERPGDAILSEESPPHRVEGASRLWIVDPLDGTREYSEGRDDWAVHVALVVNGQLTEGAVALPARGITYATPHVPAPPDRLGGLRIAVSRSRPPVEALAVAAALDAQLVEMGSAGAKAMAVVRGDVDAYVHAGGQYEWDSAAPVAVALAAGLHASRLDGSPLRYGRDGAWLPDLLICRPAGASRILDALARESAA